MGGFHRLRVRQKILYKRFLCRGFKEWCIDAKIIASGSADQAWEGRHYYRSMRCHKECFDALTRVKIEEVTKSHADTDPFLLSMLVKLRTDPSSDVVSRILNLDTFNDLVTQILTYEYGTEEHLSIEYLKDVSCMLAMVSAVREGNL